MYGDNGNNNPNNQQPGDNTPPPMLDTPIANDPPAGDPMPSTAMPAPSDPPADDEQFTPSASPDFSAPATPSDPASTPQEDDASDDDLLNTSSAGTDDLLNIKQQALQQLTPLVGHLDQTPKEEFRTTMMMIQATDNQELVKKAFEAAQKIEDDKERAQAFLDIINEINYFTQNHQD